MFGLVGEGFADEAPVLGACEIVPNSISLGQAIIITLDATDSATLANIETCTATGERQLPDAPRTVLVDLVDDGSTIGDINCDGTFTGFLFSSGFGLFNQGTWDFTFECKDSQNNTSASSPLCTVVVN